MKTDRTRSDAPAPLEIEELLTPDERRVTLDDDLIEVPWPEVNPPSRRKDSELARVLDLLDNLPRGKDSK